MVVTNAGIYGNTVNAQITNTAPTTNSFAVSVDEDTVLNIDLEKFKDENNNDLIFILSASPANGTASIANSTLTFTPNLNWSGQETIAFKANDGFEDTTYLVTITVNPINDAPIANDINITTNKLVSVSIDLDASDVENDNLTYTIVQTPSETDESGTLGVLDGNTIIYTNSSGGTDSFTYKVNDGSLDSNTATVNITITANNNAPTVQDTTITIGPSFTD